MLEWRNQRPVCNTARCLRKKRDKSRLFTGGLREQSAGAGLEQDRSSAEDFLYPSPTLTTITLSPTPTPLHSGSSFLSLVLQDSQPPGEVKGKGLGVEELKRMRNFTKPTFTFLGSVFHPGDLVVPGCSQPAHCP